MKERETRKRVAE